MAATVRDVAALAGVSPSTVSRTCRNSSSISEKTKEKVRQAMAQLGYEPPAGPAGEEEPMKNIGIILPPSTTTYENPFFMEVLNGISQTCFGQKYTSMLITGKDDADLITNIQEAVKHQAVSNLIVLFSRVNDPVVRFLQEEGLDFVQVGNPASNPNETNAVDNDNIAAGYDGAAFLYNLGHRAIGYVGSPPNHWYSVARRTGLSLCLMERNLELKPEYCIEMDYSDPQGLKKLRTLLKNYADRPSAIICADEIRALIVRQLCAECGLQIPRDLSVLTFNNSILSRLTMPQMTTVDVNAVQLGVEAAIQAIKHAENPSLMPSRVLVPYQIVPRESTIAHT